MPILDDVHFNGGIIVSLCSCARGQPVKGQGWQIRRAKDVFSQFRRGEDLRGGKDSIIYAGQQHEEEPEKEIFRNLS